MIPNFHDRLIRRAREDDPDVAFIEDVRIEERTPRNPRVERTLVVAWLLIAVKCAAVSWAVSHYHMPFDPLWVNGPTVAFALMATAIYYWRD